MWYYSIPSIRCNQSFQRGRAKKAWLSLILRQEYFLSFDVEIYLYTLFLLSLYLCPLCALIFVKVRIAVDCCSWAVPQVVPLVVPIRVLIH
nr:MAG TPA: hypothetical protein [Caudoviricetes sp.]